MLQWFETLPFAEFLALLAAANLMMYLASWGGVATLRRLMPDANINVSEATVTPLEVGLSLGVVVLNTAVGVPGWWLWQSGHITLSEGSVAMWAFDVALLFFYFDLGMYVLHRMAHTEPIFGLIHAKHHDHVDVGGLSLYVMHPAEAFGFGMMLVVFLSLHTTHIAALMTFLFFNWLYGTVGHSGLALSHQLLRWLAGDSSFHHDHHRLGEGNYGFFTPVWDRMLGTYKKGS